MKTTQPAHELRQQAGLSKSLIIHFTNNKRVMLETVLLLYRTAGAVLDRSKPHLHGKERLSEALVLTITAHSFLYPFRSNSAVSVFISS